MKVFRFSKKDLQDISDLVDPPFLTFRLTVESKDVYEFLKSMNIEPDEIDKADNPKDNDIYHYTVTRS